MGADDRAESPNHGCRPCNQRQQRRSSFASGHTHFPVGRSWCRLDAAGRPHRWPSGSRLTTIKRVPTYMRLPDAILPENKLHRQMVIVHIFSPACSDAPHDGCMNGVVARTFNSRSSSIKIGLFPIEGCALRHRLRHAGCHARCLVWRDSECHGLAPGHGARRAACRDGPPRRAWWRRVRRPGRSKVVVLVLHTDAEQAIADEACNAPSLL